METQLSFDFPKSKPSLRECPSKSQLRLFTGTSSPTQSDSLGWPQDTAPRPPKTPTPPTTSSMAVEQSQQTPPSGLQCGEMIRFTLPSPKEKSRDYSIETWVNGQSLILHLTPTKLTVTTSSGRLVWYSETG